MRTCVMPLRLVRLAQQFPIQRKGVHAPTQAVVNVTGGIVVIVRLITNDKILVMIIIIIIATTTTTTTTINNVRMIMNAITADEH